jgi:hypothetical protein
MNKPKQDYQNKTQSKKFLQAAYLHNKPSLVGERNRMGVFCDLPILKAEYYLCDLEPQVKSYNKPRIVIWNRGEGVKRPKGWIEMSLGIKYTALAVADLNLNECLYYKNWSSSSKTSRNKWLSQTDYNIVETDVVAYMAHYDASIVPLKMRNVFKKQIYDYIEVYKSDVHFFLAIEVKTEKVLSGFCCVDDFESNQSLHLVGFRSVADIPRYIGIGIIDYWMKHLQKIGIRYANLGVVWQKGDPKDWIGYSNFKMHFSPAIFRFEKPLFKLTFK